LKAFLAVWACCLALAVLPRPTRGQDPAPLSLSVAPASGRLSIQIGNLFDEGGLTRALHSGLPLRIEIATELWKDGFFDSQRGRADWRASVVYDPLEQRYRVTTGENGTTEVYVDSLAAVRSVLQEAFSVPLTPRENGRFYYLGQVEVQTLSLSDLEELQRWLHGELAPAVAGGDKVGSAVGRGVRRMLVRMLGLPARRFQVRTETFEIRDREH